MILLRIKYSCVSLSFSYLCIFLSIFLSYRQTVHLSNLLPSICLTIYPPSFYLFNYLSSYLLSVDLSILLPSIYLSIYPAFYILNFLSFKKRVSLVLHFLFIFIRVADPDPVGSGMFCPDPDPELSFRIRIRPI